MPTVVEGFFEARFGEEEGATVGVIDRGESGGFVFEAGEDIPAVGDVAEEDPDGYNAVEAGVACLWDFAHSSGANGGADFVGAESGAGGEGHGAGGLPRVLDAPGGSGLGRPTLFTAQLEQ